MTFEQLTTYTSTEHTKQLLRNETISPLVRLLNDKSIKYRRKLHFMCGDPIYYSSTYGFNNWVNDTTRRGTLIGVCVIPSDFLPDRKARIIALDQNSSRFMALDSNGSTTGTASSSTNISVSGSNVKTYTWKFPNIDGTINGDWKLIPIDYKVGNNANFDLISNVPPTGNLSFTSDLLPDAYKTFRYNKGRSDSEGNPTTTTGQSNYKNRCLPNPYNTDMLTLNSKFNVSGSCFESFNGKEQTKLLYNWSITNTGTTKTVAESLGNNTYTSDHSNAAAMCYKYKTVGTNAGDWYLPSIGELTIMFTRMGYINSVLAKLNKTKLSEGTYYWSSSLCNATNAFGVNAFTSDFYVISANFFNACTVRPMLQL